MPSVDKRFGERAGRDISQTPSVSSKKKGLGVPQQITTSDANSYCEPNPPSQQETAHSNNGKHSERLKVREVYQRIQCLEEINFLMYHLESTSTKAKPSSLVRKKLTGWCALWAGGIIGPYFFKNDEGHNVTVNGDRYRAMITNFFIPELNNHDVQELWFQQDGATCHTARATIDLLKDTFGDHLISRLGPVNWRPRSRDLTLLDYFLWSYVKSLVYAYKPQTLDHLEDNIRRVIADIRPQML
ncbi:DUF4817 domain-containing protein [Trichonephila clavipes]|nr:DUF4817 domain-containing protein [Trichonephila clavipes]